MRYIGSKARVLDFLEDCIHSCIPTRKGLAFVDLFAGTTIVAQHFKRLGYRIISNDYMAFSYILQLAMIKNSREPSFRKLGIGNYRTTLKLLNSLKTHKGFFYNNYCKNGQPKGSFQRNYFSPDNAGKIDAIMQKLRKWRQEIKISFNQEAILRASLIDAVTRVSNISGTYGSFLNRDDPRKFKQMHLEPLMFIPSQEKHTCFNKDALTLIDRLSGDILYLDPPYNQRQYPPYYHILETLSLDDEPAIYGKTGRRPYKDKLSPFCIKTQAKAALTSLIKRAQFKHIFISYNSEGLLTTHQIRTLMSAFGKVKIFSRPHRRFRSNNNGKNHTKVKELLFYVHKNNREK